MKNSLYFAIIAWSNKTGYAFAIQKQSFIAKALKLGRQNEKNKTGKY
ncbi:hypothetical protein ACM1SS_001780 [Campylobacter coli]